MVGMGAWAGSKTGTITFGSANGSLNVNSASASGEDNLNNSWTVTTEGTSSFTPNAAYAQIGSSKKPATSITFTTTLPKSVTITAMSAKFGGFSDTAGNITLKVGSTTVGTGSLNAATDVTVNSTTSATGNVLTVTVTGIAKGVKVYNISYTYETDGDDEPGDDTPDDNPLIPSAGSSYFVKITSQDDIVDGGQYIIVREDNAGTFAAGIQPDDSKKYLTVNEFDTKGSYYGTVNTPGKPYVYTLKASTNLGYFYLINEENYLTCASSGTDLTLNSSVSDSGYSDWKLEITSQKNVTITNKDAKTGTGTSATLKQIRFNSDKFAAYSSSTGNITTLYRYIPSVAISAAGYATFFDKDNAVTVPTGVEAYVAYLDGDFNFVKAYSEGETIPANTPVVLKGEGLAILNHSTGGNAPAKNDLIGVTEDLTTAQMEADNTGKNEFFALMNGANGVGFYWKNAGGAAFDIAAGKVYLAYSSAELDGAGAKGFAFADAEVDGIENVTANIENNVVYNLAGQRVAAIAKGIVIVNGKKNLNK